VNILKVSAQSSSIATAGALANTIRQQGQAEIQGIGPKAINQAVKAIAISRSYLASSGVDLIAVPNFVDVEVEGQKRTAIRFQVQPRNILSEMNSDIKFKNSSSSDSSSDEEVVRVDFHEPDLEEIQSESIEIDEQTAPPAREEGRFIRNFPENPLERDDFGI
jgi:stage V sporulation protein S